MGVFDNSECMNVALTVSQDGLTSSLCCAWHTSHFTISQGMTALTLVTESYAVKKGDFVLVHAAAGGTGQVTSSTHMKTIH